MLQFFAGQGAELRAQGLIGGIAEHQLQGDARRLAFAMGVVNQHQISAGHGLLEPGLGAGGRQPLHPSRLALQEHGHGCVRSLATKPWSARE